MTQACTGESKRDRHHGILSAALRRSALGKPIIIHAVSAPLYTVNIVDWNACRTLLQTVRRVVFIEEQRVPEDLEWDDIDGQCVHALACDQAGRPIGTGRLLPSCHLGRMAVVQAWRTRGVGSAILLLLVEEALRRGCGTVHLNAQTHALAFYEKHGFRAAGDIFLDAGIPHRTMTLMRAPA